MLVRNCYGSSLSICGIWGKKKKQLAEIIINDFMTVECGIETLAVNMAIAQE